MSEAVIDQTTYDDLKKLVGEDFIGELVETFFEEAPGLLAEMRQALDGGDAEVFRRSAHSLKSNSASFGATQLASLARDLEYMGRDSQLDEARKKMPELEAAYARAVKALKALL
ncbi:MAG: Hpt domain-containing protein [Candidatus Promineifilaceae bacterium]